MALAQSLPRLLTSALVAGVGIAQARLGLLAVDLEAALLRFLAQIVAWLAIAALLVIASLFGAAFVVTMFWDSHRLLAFGLVGGAYLASGLGLGWLAVRALNRDEGCLAATLAELEKDRALFGRGLTGRDEAPPEGPKADGLEPGSPT